VRREDPGPRANTDAAALASGSCYARRATSSFDARIPHGINPPAQRSRMSGPANAPLRRRSRHCRSSRSANYATMRHASDVLERCRRRRKPRGYWARSAERRRRQALPIVGGVAAMIRTGRPTVDLRPPRMGRSTASARTATLSARRLAARRLGRRTDGSKNDRRAAVRSSFAMTEAGARRRRRSRN